MFQPVATCVEIAQIIQGFRASIAWNCQGLLLSVHRDVQIFPALLRHTHTHLHFENTECFSANSLSKRRKQNIKTDIYFPQLFQVRTCLNNIPNNCSN